MGKKDDGNDDDDDNDIAINCDGNGAVIPVLLSHRRCSCWREYWAQWIHDPVGDQRKEEAVSRRGGGGNHGPVVTVSIMMIDKKWWCVCLCVLFLGVRCCLFLVWIQIQVRYIWYCTSSHKEILRAKQHINSFRDISHFSLSFWWVAAYHP